MTGIELKKSKEKLDFVKDRFYDFPEETGISDDIANIENAIKAIDELEEYYTIGSFDECREAREKQIPKKPIRVPVGHNGSSTDGCPICKTEFYEKVRFCQNCGNKMDWES